MKLSESHFLPLDSVSSKAQLLLFRSGDLLVHENGYLWPLSIASALRHGPYIAVAVDRIDPEPCFAVALDEREDAAVLGARSQSPRQVLMDSSFAHFATIGKALQLLHWVRSHRFCGHCGYRMDFHSSERSLICTSCRLNVYPRISPCVIVLVTRGNEILLARHAGRASQFFSCLAGFMEVGETPEETIVREVREEVGIEVRNIEYVSSQSWPFPSQLMLGFFAEHAGGDIVVDGKEIAEARWFMPSELPETPSSDISVAGQLIELFLKSRKS